MADIIAFAEAAGEFITDVDGFVYYWPKNARGGHLAAHHLRALADELDRRNAPWEAQINAYFKEPK